MYKENNLVLVNLNVFRNRVITISVLRVHQIDSRSFSSLSHPVLQWLLIKIQAQKTRKDASKKCNWLLLTTMLMMLVPIYDN